MKIFDFDPGEHRGAFARDGWVHIPGGATEEFVDYARSFLVERSHADALARRGIQREKGQYLLELPDACDLSTDLFDRVAALCDLRRERLTLSERHLNTYASDAGPLPRPHKDRYASLVSVGISIEVPEGSHLVIYPDDDRGVNDLLRTGVAEALLPEHQPEVTLLHAREVVIHDRPGDVQAFRGSGMWHLRRNPANAVVVYFKLNDFGSDPLAEDPTTVPLRERSQALVADGRAPADAVPALARQFEAVTREYPRSGGPAWLNVHMFGQEPRRITELEHEVIRSVDGHTTAGELASAAEVGDRSAVEAALVRLVRLGAVDLVEESSVIYVQEVEESQS